jgi:hypothetical protein
MADFQPDDRYDDATLADLSASGAPPASAGSILRRCARPPGRQHRSARDRHASIASRS